jgi:hypothetical protein
VSEQEYVYRVCGRLDDGLKSTVAHNRRHANEIADDLRATPRVGEVWIERALIGDWERVG